MTVRALDSDPALQSDVGQIIDPTVGTITARPGESGAACRGYVIFASRRTPTDGYGDTRNALSRSSRSAASEVRDADCVGQADRRAGRVRVGASHNHGDQRLPRREATLQLVAVPVRCDLLPALRGHSVSDLLARDVTRDGLPSSGRGAGPRSGGPVARAVAGGAPDSLDRGAASDQGTGLPSRDVATAPGLPPAAVRVDRVAATLLVVERTEPADERSGEARTCGRGPQLLGSPDLPAIAGIPRAYSARPDSVSRADVVLGLIHRLSEGIRRGFEGLDWQRKWQHASESFETTDHGTASQRL